MLSLYSEFFRRFLRRDITTDTGDLQLKTICRVSVYCAIGFGRGRFAQQGVRYRLQNVRISLSSKKTVSVLNATVSATVHTATVSVANTFI